MFCLNYINRWNGNGIKDNMYTFNASKEIPFYLVSYFTNCHNSIWNSESLSFVHSIQIYMYTSKYNIVFNAISYLYKKNPPLMWRGGKITNQNHHTKSYEWELFTFVNHSISALQPKIHSYIQILIQIQKPCNTQTSLYSLLLSTLLKYFTCMNWIDHFMNEFLLRLPCLFGFFFSN